MAARIRKGDTVEVLAGKHKGMRGTVMRVDARARRVLVERVNIVKRHQRPSGSNRQGGIIEAERPISLSKVALVHKDARTKVGFRMVGDRRVRWSRKHDEAIDE